MLFLALLLCVLLHDSGIQSQNQLSLCDGSYSICPYPQTTSLNKIYGYSKGIATLSLYNRSDSYLAFNASCLSGSYVSITHSDIGVPDHETAYIFKAQYATAYCAQIDCYSAPTWFVDVVNPHTCMFFDAVDCLGKSLVALRLLSLLHVSLHSGSRALWSSISSHSPPIIPIWFC
jgi:hypothetical protein